MSPAARRFSNPGTLETAHILSKNGMVEILVVKPSGEHRIRSMGKGELFGEVSLIDYEPRTATVRAIERTVLVPIPRKLMESLLEKSDPVLRHLLLVILERFRHRIDGSALQDLSAGVPPEQSKRRSIVKGEATQKLSSRPRHEARVKA